MSSSRALARSARSIARSDVCIFCHTRQLLPIARNRTFDQGPAAAQSYVSRRTYAQKLDVQRLRTDVDRRSRLGWFKLSKQQKILLLEPDVAEAIYSDFVAHKDRKEYGKLVKQLVTKYNVTSEHISGMGLLLFQIPDISDPQKRAMLPASPHKANAGLILQGCAEVGDPLAIKHILTAVYLHTYSVSPIARTIASQFPKSEILKYRKTLETLKIGKHGDPESLTLQGLFLEKENQPAKARLLYEQALQVPWVYTYSPQARHPGQLPVMAPWNALGYILKGSKDPSTRDQAKHAFELGASKGDDPLSCYELAQFLDRSSAEWLKWTSKAAASGHREAMVQLAEFYQDIASKDSVALQTDQSGKLKSALNWLLGWKEGSAERLAVEWFETAGNAGHKAALMQLSNWYEILGRKEEARTVLQRIIEPNDDGKEEEFPQVVHQAKGRLSGVRTV